jgi:hypothetical protein
MIMDGDTPTGDTVVMDIELEHHGLIKVPIRGRADGIYWLRFYRGRSQSVAVLTEVPGNSSLSLTNAILEISDFVARNFAVDLAELVVFEVWPKGAAGRPSVTRVTFSDEGSERTPGLPVSFDRAISERAKFTGHPEWWESSFETISEMVGRPVEPLPDHDELYGAVCAIGGGTIEEISRPIFEAVEVGSLPPPHNPSNCENYTRFADISQMLAHAGVADELAAGREFLATLTAQECAKCTYHQADWRAIADESTRIVGSLGRCNIDDYEREVESSALKEREKGWLASLFGDPVVIEGESYTNGQHRGCALRFSGARRAAVVIGYETIGQECTDWTYEGQG